MATKKKSESLGTWQEAKFYTGYLREVQQFYAREPLIQVSAQLILSVFTVAFFVFFAIRPTLSTITTLVKKIEDQNEVSERLDRKIAQLAQAQEILAAIGDQLEEFSLKAVPETPEVEKLTKQVEAVANESNVYLTALEVQGSPLVGNKTSLITPAGPQGQVAAKNGEQFVTFNFTVGGDQTGIVNFLRTVENLERSVLLTKISFAIPKSAYRKIFPLTASGRGTVYYLPSDN